MTKTPKEEKVEPQLRGCVLCSREVLDDESRISTNLGNVHGFIIKEYSLHSYETFWGSPKQSHESLCSK